MSSKPSPGFGVRRNNRPIIEITPKNTINTGIDYGRLIRGIVPIYEEYDAMIEGGYNTIEWAALNYMDKVDAVAYRRLKRLIGLHENDAVQKYHERMQQRRKKPGKRR